MIEVVCMEEYFTGSRGRKRRAEAAAEMIERLDLGCNSKRSQDKRYKPATAGVENPVVHFPFPGCPLTPQQLKPGFNVQPELFPPIVTSPTSSSSSGCPSPPGHQQWLLSRENEWDNNLIEDDDLGDEPSIENTTVIDILKSNSHLDLLIGKTPASGIEKIPRLLPSPSNAIVVYKPNALLSNISKPQRNTQQTQMEEDDAMMTD